RVGKATAGSRLVGDTHRKENQWQRKKKIQVGKRCIAKNSPLRSQNLCRRKVPCRRRVRECDLFRPSAFRWPPEIGLLAPSRGSTLSEQQPPTVTIPRQPWFV